MIVKWGLGVTTNEKISNFVALPHTIILFFSSLLGWKYYMKKKNNKDIA